eukprot:CAMPEP_0174260914 /NCGR_PEP_ID=MMETSP0439-20130205/10994_1 /TAXON_ID=0 /ORGANISM="Stereomyxa ramosa, Strain Chinc5" /LENGTH=376 /DNA_ID=CAMNT_0015345293 /DNA_START=89 /DNA_END=1219 /DNA_ORIENTATION=-
MICFNGPKGASSPFAPSSSTSFAPSLTFSPSRPTSTLPPARLEIIEHQSLRMESSVIDGTTKNVHMVVKNAPFVVQVAIIGTTFNSRVVDFNRLSLDAQLVFDSPENKTVPSIRGKPVEYKGSVSTGGARMKMEFKIKVLSSHMENMFFRLKLTAVVQETGEIIPELSCMTDAIKVISKPDQLRPSSSRGKKRTMNDRIMEKLEAIEAGQQQLLKEIKTSSNNDSNDFCGSSFFQPEAFSSSPLPLLFTDTPLPLQQTPTNQFESESPMELELESAYNNLIDAYKKLTAEQRPQKIRRIVRSTPAKRVATFCEMISLFTSEGLEKELGKDLPFLPPNHCLEECCEHKKELDRIEEFYKETLLLTPSTSLSSMLNFN